MVSKAFVLKSVELKNWKTFADATLNIEAEGLTGIVGRNGSGKSSFVEAILWCLYGSRPEGVVKGDLRRRKADPVKDTTSIKVTFMHAGQTIEAFRQMKGKNHTVTGAVFLDGNDMTKATGSTVEAWVTNRIGMDATGFQTAIVVPQKELDNIVDMKPAERRKSIERLAGVEEMNVAVQNARALENDISKQIKVMPGSEAEIEQAENFYEEVSTQFTVVEDRLSHAAVLENEARTKLESAIEVNKASKVHLDEGFALYEALGELENKKRYAQQAVDSLDSQLAEARQEYSGVDVSQREELQDAYRSLTQQMNEANSTFSENEQRNTSKNAELERAIREHSAEQERNADLTSKAEGAKTTLEALEAPETARKRADEANTRLSDLAASAGVLKARVADMEESIAAMSTFNEDAHCPTCQTKIANPSELVEKFTRMRDDFVAELEAKNSEGRKVRDELGDANRAIEEYRNLDARKVQAENELNQSSENLKRLDAQVVTLRAEVAALPPVDRKAHIDALDALDEERRTVLQKGEKIAQALKTMERVERLEGELAKAQNTVDALLPEISETSTKLSGYGDLEALDHTVAMNESNIEKLRSEQGRHFSDMKNLESEHGKLEERVANARENWEREKRIAAKKVEASLVLEERAAVTDLLDEYRKERISRIAPEMSVTATDMISQMTNGRFIEVLVADDFATSVVKNDGTVYAVAELSGGEKSIVALALRIAVGALITGDNAGLLWLDEVLPAQDAERRDAVLGVLRELPIQQIVMINHTHEAEDVVDRVVRVIYDDDGSIVESNSTLEEEVAEMV